MGDILGQGGKATPTQNFINEVGTLKTQGMPCPVNQVMFSPLSEDTLAAAHDDGQIVLFDTKNQK
jgi:hypothetical protein